MSEVVLAELRTVGSARKPFSLPQPRNHISLRQHPHIDISIGRAVARKVRRGHRRDSRRCFLSKDSPRLHLSSLDIDPIDLCALHFEPFVVRHVDRLPVWRPTDDGIDRFEARDGVEFAPVQRPNAALSFGSVHRHTLAIRRHNYTTDALGSDRLGVSAGQINHIVAPAVPSFNPKG